MTPFTLRKLEAGDIENCIALFQQTVHHINVEHYTLEQLKAWAPLVEPNKIDNYTYWQTLTDNIAYVAMSNQTIIGFSDLTDTGYLDRLFVHKDYQGQGIATLLFHQLENEAQSKNINEMCTHASIIAKPFFEKMGFTVMKEQEWLIRGVTLKNFIMKKKLNEC